MKNIELKKLYNKIYKKDKNKHFLKYRNGKSISEAHEFAINWLQKFNYNSIIDFGCGEGDFLDQLNTQSIKTIGMDYSEIAIETAKNKYPEIRFIMGDEKLLEKNKANVVTSFGTLEHTDNPKDVFSLLVEATQLGGILICTCPNFINLRGVIWMTLVKLFDIPMSLSDKHFLTPHDFANFEREMPIQLLEIQSVDVEISQGNDFRKDMERRLNNALKDKDYDNSKVYELIDWVEQNIIYFPQNELSGVEAIYIFKRT